MKESMDSMLSKVQRCVIENNEKQIEIIGQFASDFVLIPTIEAGNDDSGLESGTFGDFIKLS